MNLQELEERVESLERFKNEMADLDLMNFEALTRLPNAAEIVKGMEDGEYKTQATMQLSLIEVSKGMNSEDRKS